jgi:hypothetical protein
VQNVDDRRVQEPEPEPPARYVPTDGELELLRQLENHELPPDDPLMKVQLAIEGLRSLIKR